MKRNRRAGVEDRWTKTVRDEQGNAQKVPSARNGSGKRWMARYVDDEGNERAKAFDRKSDAQTWLDSEVTVKLATGTYVAPRAGLITVEEMYASWSATQGHLSLKTATSQRSAWRTHVRPQWGRRVCGRREDIGGEGVGRDRWSPTRSACRRSTTHSGSCVRCSAPRWRTTAYHATRASGVKLPKPKHADRGYLSHAQVAALAAAVERLARGDPVPGLHRAAVG